MDFDHLATGRQELLIRQAETCKIALTTQPMAMMVCPLTTSTLL